MTPRIRFSLSAGSPAPPDWGQAEVQAGIFELHAADPTTTLHTMTSWALDGGRLFDTLEVMRPSLEDVYLELTGGEESENAEVPP